MKSVADVLVELGVSPADATTLTAPVEVLRRLGSSADHELTCAALTHRSDLELVHLELEQLTNGPTLSWCCHHTLAVRLREPVALARLARLLGEVPAPLTVSSSQVLTDALDLFEHHPSLSPAFTALEELAVPRLAELDEWLLGEDVTELLELAATAVSEGLASSRIAHAVLGRAPHRPARPCSVEELLADRSFSRRERTALARAHQRRYRPGGRVMLHLGIFSATRLVEEEHLAEALELRYRIAPGVLVLPRSLEPLLRAAERVEPRLSSVPLTPSDGPALLETAAVLLGDGERSARQALREARALL